MAGRKRSENARLAVLEATRVLVADVGFESMSIEGIAAAAGVSKQTIYRWWPSKAHVLSEAMREGDLPITTPLDWGENDIAGDIQRWLLATRDHLASADNAALVRALIMVAASDQQLSDSLTGRFARPIIGQLVERLEAARAAGQVRADLNLDAIAGVLLSVASFSALTGYVLTEEYIEDIVTTLNLGFRP